MERNRSFIVTRGSIPVAFPRAGLKALECCDADKKYEGKLTEHGRKDSH